MTGDIRIHPDPHLRTMCIPVVSFDSSVEAMASGLLQVMYAGLGRGLAAPQAGFDRLDARIFVMDAGWKDTGERAGRVFVNPDVTWASENTAVCEEGCLSIPDQPRRLSRPAEIELSWQDMTGARHQARFSGAEAVIIQHERDHLDGILILDHPEAPK